MKTIAEQLKHDFSKGSLRLYDSNGNEIYYEEPKEYDCNGNQIYEGYWYKQEYDSNGKEIYFETSDGYIEDNRPKESCEGKVVEIDGKTYKLVELNK